jgi:hypothetical protein
MLIVNTSRGGPDHRQGVEGQHIGELEGNRGPARDAFVEPLNNTGITATEGLISRVIQDKEGIVGRPTGAQSAHADQADGRAVLRPRPPRPH